MNKNLIISTSINPPTEAIQKFDNLKNWTLIVNKDKKTPKNYKLKNGNIDNSLAFASTITSTSLSYKLGSL